MIAVPSKVVKDLKLRQRDNMILDVDNSMITIRKESRKLMT
jgi:hypothetical protein